VVLLGEAVSVLRSEWSATVSDTARLAALRALWPQVCALSGHVADRVGDIHVAGAATADGFASTMAFLRRRLRMDTALAARLIRVGADMGYLAAVRVALGEGEISVEHADAIRYVAADLGEQVMAGGELEKILLDYAKVKTPGEVRRLGRLIKAHMATDEDADERQVRLHEGRWLTATTTFEGMVRLEGMLDPVVGAAVLAALEAYMPGPDPDGSRTPRQRRADAFEDIVAVALANQDRSLTGEEKPHVTVTVSFETLLQRHAGHAGSAEGERDPESGADTAADPAAGPEAGTGPDAATGPESGTGSDAATGPEAGTGSDSRTEPTAGTEITTVGTETTADDPAAAEAGTDEGSGAEGPGGDAQDSANADVGADGGVGSGLTAWDVAVARRRAELAALRPPSSMTPAEAVRAYLTAYLRPGGMPLLGPSFEPISAETARRLACDAKVLPVVLGSRSEPLDIGRASRTVPLPMRRAVELRDVHCRFPGCDRPLKWCEAHHIRFWVRDDGPTEINNLLLLCKFHHVRIHEYGWVLSFDPVTGTVSVIRPDGTPHDIISTREGPAP
jgi:hypothetical protein